MDFLTKMHWKNHECRLVVRLSVAYFEDPLMIFRVMLNKSRYLYGHMAVRFVRMWVSNVTQVCHLFTGVRNYMFCGILGHQEV